MSLGGIVQCVTDDLVEAQTIRGIKTILLKDSKHGYEAKHVVISAINITRPEKFDTCAVTAALRSDHFIVKISGKTVAKDQSPFYPVFGAMVQSPGARNMRMIVRDLDELILTTILIRPRVIVLSHINKVTLYDDCQSQNKNRVSFVSQNGEAVDALDILTTDDVLSECVDLSGLHIRKLDTGPAISHVHGSNRVKLIAEEVSNRGAFPHRLGHFSGFVLPVTKVLNLVFHGNEPAIGVKSISAPMLDVLHIECTQWLPSISELDAPNLRSVFLISSKPVAGEFGSWESHIRFDERWHNRARKTRSYQGMDYSFMKRVSRVQISSLSIQDFNNDFSTITLTAYNSPR